MKARPTTLQEVAIESDSLEDFGRGLRDWLHEVRRFSSRAQLERALADEPPRLEGRFAAGQIADAWLAAYAEHAASIIDRAPPAWAFDPSRTAQEPWFAPEAASRGLRFAALANPPLAFKRRNIYTSEVELTLRLHAGRPRKTEDQKRRSNAARQRRFSQRRKRQRRARRAVLLRRKVPGCGCMSRWRRRTW